MGTPHPLYLGLVNSSPLPAAALADLLVSSLNNNGGAFHQSPAMTTCEAEVVRAYAGAENTPSIRVMEKVGLPAYLITTQTYPRSQDYRLLATLAALAACAPVTTACTPSSAGQASVRPGRSWIDAGGKR